MYKIIIITAIALSLLSCAPEKDPDADSNPNNAGPSSSTHQVCAFDEDNDDLLKTNRPIDQALDWLLIESMVIAAGDIDIDQDPNDITRAFAVTAFLAPSITDMFSGLNILYVCTEESYALDQCNWELETNSETGASMRLSTTVGAGQNYTSTMQNNDGSGYVTQVVVDGVIGDLGNMNITTYKEGVAAVTRASSRTSSGTETVQYSSTDSNWIATESSNCSGSLDFDSTDKDGDVTRVDAQWTLSGDKTNGSLVFFKTGMDGDYQLSW